MYTPSYDYLEHHGIEGQKWGKRNGPPYPLDYNDHSAAEKKKNPKGKLDKYSRKEEKIERRRLKEKYNNMRYASAVATIQERYKAKASGKYYRAEKKGADAEKVKRLEAQAKQKVDVSKRANKSEVKSINEFLSAAKKYTDTYGTRKIKDLTVDNGRITNFRKADRFITMRGTLGMAMLAGPVGGGLKALSNLNKYDAYVEDLPKAGKPLKLDDRKYKALYGEQGLHRLWRP